MGGKTGKAGWRFWVDRGGTFTDVVAVSTKGEVIVKKLLSEDPGRYRDAALHAIRECLGAKKNARLPTGISEIKLGTTVATNALLERQGEKVALVTTEGFADALAIGDQRRPELFSLKVAAPEILYAEVIEAGERLDADGRVLRRLDVRKLDKDLKRARRKGCRAAAIGFLHGYLNPAHEKRAAALARKAGFAFVTTSHETAPVIKFVPRTSTAVVDAYLSPILMRYVEAVRAESGKTPLYFMQSSGGLAEAAHFRGKDALLSGPAGGLIGAAAAAAREGISNVISFDMGGTSTDVAHVEGAFERGAEETVAGIKLKVPMLKIHTVAAGGGSICRLAQGRFAVGPKSAGARPGPACYGLGGPLTVTDCNLLLGRIVPEHFPRVFGKTRDRTLDKRASLRRMGEVLRRVNAETGAALSPEQAAEGFVHVANEHMARAVKKISIQRGKDVRAATLVAFGSAGGQHAAAIAEALGIRKILIHPLAGVLSAFGIGQSALQIVREQSVEKPLSASGVRAAKQILARLERRAIAGLKAQGARGRIAIEKRVHLKFRGSDTAIPVAYASRARMKAAFARAHRALFGFSEAKKPVLIHSAEVEAKSLERPLFPRFQPGHRPRKAAEKGRCFVAGRWRRVPVLARAALSVGQTVPGPAIIAEAHGTNFVPPGWRAVIAKSGNLILERKGKARRALKAFTRPDPILLEIFNNRFMAIAEEMGVVLEHTAHSVNIKERLDFSCALFDPKGELVANAPHMPVHLGSMSESVKTIAARNKGRMRPGDAYILNDPYHGGTHLPDVTVVMPVFLSGRSRPDFFVASRGHHADLGGMTPGSMPPFSKTIGEEGVLFDNVHAVRRGKLDEARLRKLLTVKPFPARNPEQNLADIKAKIAACRRGADALERMAREFGLPTVRRFMAFVQDNAASAVRRVIGVLRNGRCTYPLDNGLVLKVRITVNRTRRTAVIDFTGTSRQAPNNYNAPRAVAVAAVLYVFRCLVGEEIPLNAGCLKPLKLRIPKGSILDPVYPAAVAAGNVETSQALTNALLLALGQLAASQGTMNNLTLGNRRFQYYETIAGGSGAGPGFDGASARQVHMTNSRLTDAEVLETRFPLRLMSFSIRRGSGGPSTWRGGDGTVREIRALETMDVAVLSGHRVIPPPGLYGGRPGACGKNAIRRANGTREPLAGADTAVLGSGDVVRVETPGGGGFGRL
jgi:5-oxoprolinase (ATP-hydrolysing)